jgi:hypothetical protein
VDPSGGRHDTFALCIGHKEGAKDGTFICDVIRGVRPPFDPQEVVREFCQLLADYRVRRVYGDNYSAAWVETASRDQGIRYVRSEQSKSQIYLNTLPLFTRAAISIPDHPPLIRELRLLERQVHKGGRDTVDHPRRGSDDLANALAGAAALAAHGGSYNPLLWADDDSDPQKAAVEQEQALRRARLQQHITNCLGFNPYNY